MKVLITTDWYKPVINGVVTSVINLSNELRALGHEVKILTLSEDLSSKKDEDVYYIKSHNAAKIYPDARASIKIRHKYINELISWGPDIIHSQCEFSSFLFAKRISKRLNIPIVHTYHTVYEDYTHYFSSHQKLAKKTVSFFTKFILNHTHTVITPTDKVKKLLSGYGVQKQICTVPTGIDLQQYNTNLDENEINKLKEKLNIPKENKIIVTIGRIAKEKNISQTISYLHKLDKPNLTYLIVGDGPDREALETQVKELGMEKTVLFTGMVSPKDVHKYYQISDIFVSASTSETQGLTYIEALASGLPSICQKDTCIDQVIINDHNGYQFETYEEFSTYLENLLSDPDLYFKMSNAAISVASRYSTETFGKTVEKIYELILQQQFHMDYHVAGF